MSKRIILVLIFSLVFTSLGSESLKELHEKGLEALAAEKYEEGILYLRSIYLKSPNSKYAQSARFYAAFFARDIYQQIVEYKEFLKKYPNSTFAEDAYYFLAMNYYVSSNYNNARYYLEQYLWNFPGGKYSEKVHFYLGIIAMQTGENDLYYSKMSSISRDRTSDFFLPALFHLGVYYRSRGIDEKLKEVERELNGAFPPSKISNTFDDPYDEGETEIWSLQLGAFSKREGAEIFKSQLEENGITDLVILNIGKYYKVFSGAWNERKQAKKQLKILKKKGHEARIVKREK